MEKEQKTKLTTINKTSINDDKTTEDEDNEEVNVSLFEKLNQPALLKNIVIALGVIIVVICVGFIVYQFYTRKAQQKIDICQQEKIDSYENKLNELNEKTEEYITENNKLNVKLTELQKSYNELLETNKKLEYNNKPQAVFKTSAKPKSQRQKIQKIDMDEDNEYAVERINFDDAPINTKNKKNINPKQALKTHINESAKKAYDKKQLAIRQQMDTNDDEQEEQEQFEIRQQLGLTRELNDDKIMSLIDEQQNEEQNNAIEDVENNDVQDEQVEEIDSTLIA